MRLDRVTITGADDATDIADMLSLSEAFPFVEWGILSSASQNGSPRFPSDKWVERLLASKNRAMKLSLHLCGRWVRSLLLGINDLPGDGIANEFERIQLNFHAENTPCKPFMFWQALHAIDRDHILSTGGSNRRQWIFQVDDAGGNRHLESIYAENDANQVVDAVPLFDVSGGSGLTPAKWPEPEYVEEVDPETGSEQFLYHGYAGGLGPDNVEHELRRIAQAAGNTRIWIDMENNVRTDGKLDMAKVRRVLEICAPMIEKKP